MPAPLLPVGVIGFAALEMYVSKPDACEPETGFQGGGNGTLCISDFFRKPISFFMDMFHGLWRNLRRLGGAHGQAQPVDARDAPEEEAVGHILAGTLHPAACRGGDHYRLFPEISRFRAVYQPACAEVIEKGHHLAGGMIDVHWTGQNQHIRRVYGLYDGPQLLIMGTLRQIRTEAGPAARAGLVEIPGRKNSSISPPIFSASSRAIR